MTVQMQLVGLLARLAISCGLEETKRKKRGWDEDEEGGFLLLKTLLEARRVVKVETRL